MENETSRGVAPAGTRVSENITLGSDGKYRWTYAVNLFKNPVFFLLVWKLFFFIVLIIFAFTTVVDLIDWGGFSLARTLGQLKIFGIIFGGMTALVTVGYLIYAAIMRGKYVVEFEMDEKGVLHRQVASQAKKSQKIGGAAMAAGILAGNYGAAAAGAASQRTEMYSDFSRTRKVKTRRLFSEIKVVSGLEHNRIYAAKEDLGFVADYMIAHCPKLKDAGKKRA